MYDQAIIKEQLMGLAGIRQTDNPAFSPLASELLYTGSNVQINHPLINIENLDSAARDYSAYTYPAWSGATTYTLGDKVKVGSIVYASIQAANLNHVVTDAAWWEVYNALSNFIRDIYVNSIEEVMVEVFNRKKLLSQTKTLISQVRLYETPGAIQDLTVKQGRLVGLEIKLKYTENIVAIINRVGLQISQNNTGGDKLRLYLFHSSQLDPIATYDADYIKAGSFQWVTSPFKCAYMDPGYDAGGAFYLMYDEDSLQGQAIQRQVNFMEAPSCAPCTGNEFQLFNLYSKYVMVRALAIPSTSRNGLQLWDIRKNQYFFDNNFGLNLELTVRCDLTNFILQQKDVFAYAVRDMTTVKLLEMMAGSTRQNATQTKVMLQAKAELMAPIAGGMGIKKKLSDQLDAVNFEVSALDDTCLVCNKKSGISWGTAY